MGGGLMQLVAYGAQDVYLTGNPQITFFKVIYRRHTNFSVEQIRQTFSGESASGVGGRVIANISRNGDLVNKTYLVLPPMTDPGRISPDYGHAIIDYVEVEIGGQVIDRHYGHFMEAWAELTEPNPTGSVGNLRGVSIGALQRLQNNTYIDTENQSPRDSQIIDNKFTLFQRMACAGGVDINVKYNSESLGHYSHVPTTIAQELSIPLRFWFCKDPGLALPLISLQYHEVNIIFQFQPCLQHDKPELWCDYIYLDTDERRRFAQVSHEYLIEQLQLNTFEVVSGENTMICNLHFNHPVKELIWVNLNSDYWGKFINEMPAESAFWSLCKPVSTHKECLLKLNGHDRFEKRSMDHFTRTQPYQHHTSFGLDRFKVLNIITYGESQFLNPISDTIGVYSFCLKPEEHQPSGTCNFSRIDTVQLIITGDISVEFGSTLQVYAINYNVLRIMSGMGGLAYSN